MAKRKRKSKKKSHKRKVSFIFLIMLVLLLGGFFYISSNFNNILSDKIHSLYNQSQVSSYYHLKFDKIRVNLFSMNMRIYNVRFTPKEKEFSSFFEDNGSLDIQIGKIVVKEADLIAFLLDDSLYVEDFSVEHSVVRIDKPNEVFNPFAFVNDTTHNDSLNLQVYIQKVKLKDTRLDFHGDAIHNVYNRFREFGMEIEDIRFSTNTGAFQFSLENLEAILREAEINSNEKGRFSLEQLQFGISQLKVNNIHKDFNLKYSDFYIQLIKPNIITVDSLYTISMDSLRIDKKTQHLKITNAKFHPNISKLQFAKRSHYQVLYPKITVDQLLVVNFDYDQLIEKKSLFADTVYISGVHADLFKDKNKPINKHRIPKYLAGQIFSIKIPLKIKEVVVEDIQVDFSVRQPDGRLSKVDVNHINGRLSNVQNLKTDEKLYLKATGKVHNTIPFNVSLEFFYGLEVYSFSGHIYKSDLTKLSSVVRSFAPVEINKGRLNSMEFNGHVSRTDSRGTMEFLYNDIGLEVKSDDVQKKKGFQNLIVSMAANTLIYSNNPVGVDHPKRRVNFFKQRNMNKGFIDILVQSLLAGVKETIMPTKENRKKYKKDLKTTRKKKSPTE